MRDLTLYTFAFHLTTASLYTSMSDIRTTLVTSRHPLTSLKCCMHVRQLTSETIVVRPQRHIYIHIRFMYTVFLYYSRWFFLKNYLINMTQVEIILDKHSPKFILQTVQHTPVCLSV
jgi:hypothetical protein